MKYYVMFGEKNGMFYTFNLLNYLSKGAYKHYAGLGLLKEHERYITCRQIKDFLNDKSLKLLEINEKEFEEYSNLEGREILGSKDIFNRFIQDHPEALI